MIRVGATSLEIPIVLIAPGLGATEAVLEELDPGGDCRLRSLQFFSPRTQVKFTLGYGNRFALGDAGESIVLRGSIANYAVKGQRFVYDVSLEPAEGLAEQLELLLKHRRHADGVHAPPLARSCTRAETNFPIAFRIGETWHEASAANISVGGLLMRSRELLVEGMALELRFTLPSSVLERCSDDVLLGRLWDRAVREVAQAMLRRPFKELLLRARVVCHRPISNTVGDYGMEFCTIDALAHSEIERYCAALHVVKSSAADRG